MIEYIINNPAGIAAFLSFLATALAAIATWQGPRSAALLAERIRHEKDRENERRRMKMHVFSTLMQERATIASIDSVRMLNSIDFVFNDSPKVREAWAELFVIFQTDGPIHPQLREEKLRSLLREMTADLGMSGMIRVDDLGRIYYPNGLAREEELRLLQQERALRAIRSQQDETATSSVDHKLMQKFPPVPE